MIENIGPVKNPLTIIAMFAAIAEISGTIVLPFVTTEHQEIYVWFLMLFPFFLVAVFFITLNFNHKVLYAPSDYRDEGNFMRASFSEKLQKYEEEITEAELNEDVLIDENNTTDLKSKLYQRLISKSSKASYMMLAEDMVFEKLKNEFSMEINRDVRAYDHEQRNSYVFDGVVADAGKTTLIEIKHINENPLPRIKKTIHQIESYLEYLPSKFQKKPRILVVITTENEAIIHESLENKMLPIINNASIPVEFRVYSVKDLEK